MRIRYFVLLVVMTTSAIATAQTTQPSRNFDVRGIVTHRAGTPVPNAEIDVFTGGRNYEPPRPFTRIGHTVADAKGEFALGVMKPNESAPHQVRATAPGMAYAYVTGPGYVN